MAKPIPIILALLLVVASSRAQSLPDLQRFGDPAASVPDGSTIEIVDLGDLDGDFRDDYGVVFATSFVHYSTTNGAVLLHEPLATPPITRQASRIMPLPDLDGDGYPEFAFVLPNIFFLPAVATEIRVASGLTATILASFAVPNVTYTSFDTVRMVAIGDRNGDGATDFVLTYVEPVSVTPAIWDTHIDIVDGATWTLTHLVTFPNQDLPPGGLFHVGDVDGDGIGDFVTGSPLTSALIGHGGSASVFSGATGVGIRHWLGQTVSEQLGASIVPLDDIDGDGIRDIAAFAPGGAPAGRVWFFSPGSGLAIGSIAPSPGFAFLSLEAAGDVNGDGFRDVMILVADQVQSTAHNEIRSGTNGDFMTSLPRSAHPVGDLNSDGLDDHLDVLGNYASSSATYAFQGRAFMGAQSYGFGLGGRFLDWQPFANAPATGALHFGGAASSAPIVGAVSLRPAATTIFGTNFPLLVSVAPGDLVGTFDHVADANGQHVDLIDLRRPSLAGVVVYIQFAELGATPGTSNAVEMMFGPQP